MSEQREGLLTKGRVKVHQHHHQHVIEPCDIRGYNHKARLRTAGGTGKLFQVINNASDIASLVNGYKEGALAYNPDCHIMGSFDCRVRDPSLPAGHHFLSPPADNNGAATVFFGLLQEVATGVHAHMDG